MHIPDFFIIGAAKAGTTSLTSQLKACPSVFMTTPKEPEFFARDDLFAAGPGWYSALFEAARPNQVTGESSTLYSLAGPFPKAAARIVTTAPEARIIYMLRHPVARTFSMYQEVLKHYQNDSGTAEINRSFEEFLFPDRFPNRAPREKVIARFDSHYPDDPDLLLDGSDYARQAEEYIARFPRRSIHFILFEDYVRNRERHLADVLAFLGVDPAEAAVVTTQEIRNTSRNHFLRSLDDQRMAGLSRRFVPPAVKDALPVAWRAGLRRGLLSALHLIDSGSGAPAPMHPDTRDWLTDRFAPHYEEIERLTGLDLTVWRQIDSAWRNRRTYAA
ncbi:sulfotransferase domain-containing protein [Tropicimonas sp. IMCC6043]|uniref:sulfotransferase domain-containing protein n=1 Tax=Tropicimonas sp. IMCC6043 TaxID=2510645 RepID=UPI0013EA377B|nr:sulfotransferase domain-containing protein [Tropicimonas sp. IMCC6043]